MEYIEVGTIANTHGIRGEVKINAWTDDIQTLLDNVCFYLKDETVLTVENIRLHKNMLVVKFQGINTLTDAERYKGKTVYTEKIPLPEGRFYIKDLIGLTVVENNEHIGKLTDVFNTGANDIYEVTTEEKKKIYLPVIDGVIDTVDLSAKTMTVHIPAGLLEG